MDSEDRDHWTHLRALVQREWGTREQGGGARFTLAARAAANDTDDTQAIVKMRQVCFAQREIHSLIDQVEQIVRGEKRAQEEPLVPVAADYGRRGNL